MNFSFEPIDFTKLLNDSKTEIKESQDLIKSPDNYDETTSEIYRVKRLYKIDPILHTEIKNELIFEFKYKWNPYNGIRGEIDKVGPLCFNAINLYDYYYINRYIGLWTPPQDGYQAMYGDNVGSGFDINIKSRGSNPEKYLFRLPIIDCYLPPNHNLSVVTMGPKLTEDEITQIDLIVKKYHPKKYNFGFASLTMLKYYYDRALDMFPDPDLDEIIELKFKFPNLSEKDINQKFNRYYVDKLVNIKY